MRLRCVAGTGPTAVERWVEGDDTDDTFALAHLFAATHVKDHVAVYDEAGDLEFDSGPGVP